MQMPELDRTVAPRSYVHILTLEPLRVTVFGKKVFADVIKSKISR